MFDTLHKAGAGAEFAYELADEAEMDATFITASLKVHYAMDVFIKSQFSEHPEFTAKLVRHMFDSSVSRAELNRVAEAAREAATSARKVATAQDSLSKQVTKLDTKVERACKNNSRLIGGAEGGGNLNLVCVDNYRESFVPVSTLRQFSHPSLSLWTGRGPHAKTSFDQYTKGMTPLAKPSKS